MTELLILFIVLNIVNVVLNTVKSILTVKGGAFSAALINAVTFFVYTYVLIYMNSDLPMLAKASVVAACNFVGVFVVKMIEKAIRKDKLWKVEATIKPQYIDLVRRQLEDAKLSYSFIDINKYFLFNIYCENQQDSAHAKWILDKCKAKYFVSESKSL